MAVILRNITVSGFLLSLMLAPLLGEARADIYQCIDQQGGVLFTDTPTRTGCRLLVGQKRGGVAPSSWSPARFDDIILSSSQRYGVDPALVRAVVKVESDFNEAARSHKGAQGLMQLMPETARLHNVGNVYDPDENVDGGVRHLRLLLDRYQGDLQLTLAAYNAGIQAVDKFGGIPPFSETKEYVRRVLDYHQRYRKGGQIVISQDRGGQQ